MNPIKSEELFRTVSIDTVSKLLNISTSKLRYYDYQGIINSKRRDDSNNAYRIYERDDILELVDFILYRNLDVPSKEILNFYTLDPELQYTRLFDMISANQQKIQDIIAANDEFLQQSLRIQKYLELKEKKYRRTNKPDISYIKEFHLWNPQHMQQWLKQPYSQSYCFIHEEGCGISEGLADSQSFDSAIIWKNNYQDINEKNAKSASGTKKVPEYLECVTRTRGAYPNLNNISSHYDYIQSLGANHGKAIPDI